MKSFARFRTNTEVVTVRAAAWPKPWDAQLQRLAEDEKIVLGLVVSLFLSPWLTAAMIGLVVLLLVRRHEAGALLASVRSAAALPLFCLITFAVSLASANPVGILAAVGFGFLLLVTLFVRTRMTRDLFEKIVDTACVASLYGFAVMVLQRLAGPDTLEFRAPSVFLNANYYAAVTEIVVLMCLYRLLEKGRPHRWHYALIAAANLGGLYLSDCRSGAMALAAAILVLLLLNRRHGILVVAAIGGVIALTGAALHPGIFPRYALISPDLMTRLAIWRAALLGFLQHPLFGLGTQAYRLVYGQFGGPPTVHAHNLLLDPLLNYGVVGMTLLGIYGTENLRAIRRLRDEACDHSRLYLLIAVSVSILVHGMTDIAIGSLHTALLVSILLGAAGLTENPQRRPLTLAAHAGAWTVIDWQSGRQTLRLQPRPQLQPQHQPQHLQPQSQPASIEPLARRSGGGVFRIH